MNKICNKIKTIFLISLLLFFCINFSIINEVYSSSGTLGYKYENDKLTYTYQTKNGKKKTVSYTYNSVGVSPGQNRPVYILGGTDSQMKEAKEYNAKAYVYKDEIEELIESNVIYKQPENTETKSSINSLDDFIDAAKKFISSGVSQIDQSKLQKFSQVMYNILLTIGIIAAVVIGGIIGIKLMTGGVEEKAKTKKILIPYIAGCIIIFGGFALWKMSVTVLDDVESTYSEIEPNSSEETKTEEITVKTASTDSVSKKAKYSIEERAEERAFNRAKKLAEEEAENGDGLSTSGTSLSQKTNDFLEALKKYLKMINKKWTYANSNVSVLSKKANCAITVTWALRDIGILDKGQSVYISGDNVINSESRLKEKMTKIPVGGKSMSELIKLNMLKEGDIIFWKNTTHTNVYAGNEMWYDSGSSATKKVNGVKRYKYDGLDKPRKVSYLNNGSQKIYAIFRFKDSGGNDNKKVETKKIDKTIASKEFDRKITVSASNGADIAQSMCITDKYYVCSMINHAETKTILNVFDRVTGTKINSLSGDLNHANGMTYNGNNKKIYIATMKNNQISSMSSENIANVKTISKKKVSLSDYVSGIDYSSSTNQYYAGGGSNLYVFDNNFKRKKHFKKKYKDTPQDVGAYKDLMLVVRTNNGSNYIDVYRNTGSYLGTYKIGLYGELESIKYDEKIQKFVLYVNIIGSPLGYVYTTSAIDLEPYAK